MSALADTCVTPSGPRQFQSSNGQWQLVIQQRRAMLSRGSRRQARWTLPNDPMSVLVANDGTTITFGNGCSEGPSDRDVVIYRHDGRLVRSLGLNDLFLPEDVAALPRTADSVHWAGMHRIDEVKHQLILEVKGPPRSFELPVSLDNGALLAPLSRHFVVPQYEPVVSIGIDPHDITAERRCEGGIPVPASLILAHARDLPLPVYPEVAVKARIQGDVVLELRVTREGAVESVKIIKGIPFGLDTAAEAAAKQWRFAPLDRIMCGRFAAHFVLRPVPAP